MDTARTIARDQSAQVVNKAREDAVAELAEVLDDDLLHYWDGPQDESTTDMCEWLKEQTNPEYGGDPVPMDELKRLQKEAVRKYGDADPYSEHIGDHHLHAQERHTHRSILRSEVED